LERPQIVEVVAIVVLSAEHDQGIIHRIVSDSGQLPWFELLWRGGQVDPQPLADEQHPQIAQAVAASIDAAEHEQPVGPRLHHRRMVETWWRRIYGCQRQPIFAEGHSPGFVHWRSAAVWKTAEHDERVGHRAIGQRVFLAEQTVPHL